MNRIEWEVLKKFSKENGLVQAVLVALDANREQVHVVTWGDTMEDCKLAAEAGNNLKRHIVGWPEELCNDVPERVKESAARGEA